MDYVGASQYDQSDGSSLRRYIEGSCSNAKYDESVVVSEHDQRAPLPGGKLSGKLGSAPNFMIRKGNYKLIITKLASSPNIDMMYNLKTDLYEMRNLIGNVGLRASPTVVGKAEHLKALLVEWMQRNNGGEHQYYSNPKYNGNVGTGDIAEITQRRTWRTLKYWQSDNFVYFGPPVFSAGKYVRYEYIYVGRTSPGVLKIRRISIGGQHNQYFCIVGPKRTTIRSGQYMRIKVAFTSSQPVSMNPIKAYVRIYNNENKVSTVKLHGRNKV